MAGPPLVVTGGFLIRLIWQFSGVDDAVNVVGGWSATPPTVSQTLVNAIDSAIKSAFSSTGLMHSLAGQVSLSRTGLRSINTANQAEIMSTNAAVAGDGTGDALPRQTAYCVTIRTSMAGRSYRGRFYVYGFCEAENVATGQPGANTLTRSPAFVNAVGAALSSNGITPAIISRKHMIATPWNTAVGRTSGWSTQRRRLKPGI